MAVEWQGVERAERKRRRWTSSQTNESTGTMPFGFQLAEGHVNGPTIRSDVAKAIPEKIDTFTDAHTGVGAGVRKDVGRQIVAAE